MHQALDCGASPPKHVAITMRYATLPKGPTMVMWLCDACVAETQPPGAAASAEAVWALLERLGEDVWPMCMVCADEVGAPHETRGPLPL